MNWWRRTSGATRGRGRGVYDAVVEGDRMGELLRHAGLDPSGLPHADAVTDDGPRAVSVKVLISASAVQSDDVPVGVGECEGPAERAVERRGHDPPPALAHIVVEVLDDLRLLTQRHR